MVSAGQWCGEWKAREASSAAVSVENLLAERDRLREVNAILLNGLRIIAGQEQCIDNLMSHVEIARAAIAKAEGRE